MKTSTLLVSLSMFLISTVFNSCKKEAEIKEATKHSAKDCPNVASLTVEKEEPLYNVVTIAGAFYNMNFSIDGILCKARFNRPSGIAIGRNEDIYISEPLSSIIRKINNQGMVSTFAGTIDNSGRTVCKGSEDGIGTAAKFCFPKRIVLNKEGILFILEGGQAYNSVDGTAIRKLSLSAQVTTLISGNREFGFCDGPLAQAKFGKYIYSIALGPDGSVFLFDSNNLIRKVSAEGIVSTHAGKKPVNGQIQTGYKDGDKENALFSMITDMTVGPEGSVYLCEFYDQRIRRISPAGMVETFAVLNAYPYSITISDLGLIIVNGRLINNGRWDTRIYKIDPNGAVHYIAGNLEDNPKDGVGKQATFRFTEQMTIHKNHLYLTDAFSTIRRMKIR